MGTVIEKEAKASPPTTPRAAVRDWATTCLNCKSTLVGPFCSECGQRAIPPHPTIRELVGEAFVEFSGWDGKLAETIRSLIRRPGQLTLEFLEGRRARFISPLRLYLLSSLVYFVLAAAAPEVTSKGEFFGLRPLPAGVSINTKGKNVDIDPFSAGDGRPKTLDALTPEEKAALAKSVDEAPRLLRPIFREALKNPTRFRSDALASMPKALFALLPAFAGILALFYRRRRFADHLYFALHLHAFTFIAMAVSAAIKFTNSFPLVLVSGLLVLVWVPVYAHLSFRRVYGGGQVGTFFKELGIGALYCLASIPALIGLAYWVAIRSGS